MTLPASAAVQAELLRSLQGNLLGIGLGNAAVAGVMAVALWGQAAPPALGAWLALQWLHSAFSVWAWWRVRARPVSLRAAPHRARASVWASATSGTLWAAAVPLFWPAERLDLQLLMLTMITGLVSGAVHSLSAHLPAFRAFFLPNVVAVVGMCLWQGGLLHLAIAVAAAAYGATGARFARAMHEVQRRALEQREELARLAADLAEQTRRAEEASRAKSRFLAAASHDIRQPVHALGLFLGAFDDAALTGRNARLIGPLRDSARGLREMLDGVLDLSRAEAGAVQAHPEPLAVQAMLDRLERELAPQAEQRGLVLRVVPSRAWVQADPALTARVLGNLANNALRYTAQGGVLVGTRRRGRHIVFEVWDTGVGIAPQDRERLFGEFTRGAEAVRTEPSGLGLGLAIARRFCAAQGSRIELASRPGRGSVFRFALPEAPPQSTPASADPGPRGAPCDGVAGLRVLLLDDDATVRGATARLLESWGCAVTLAAGPEAVDPGAAPPDLVITDNLFDGRPHAAEVGARWHGTPLLVTTGDVQAASLADLRERGVPVLAKPVEPAVLRAAMQAAMAARRPPHPGDPDAA
jgi:signal transduction histidine kinase/CheY-like chemotaxis protein